MKKLIASAVMGLALVLTPISASAQQYRSYYDLMSKWSQVHQERFATRMIKAYERSNKIYENFVNRYTRYAGQSWYERMKSRLVFQRAEIAKYQAFLDGAGVVAPTLVDTKVSVDTRSSVRRSPTVEASRNTVIEEERTETMVREYNVTTVTYETPVRTVNYTVTTTTKHFSDGSTDSDRKVKVTSVDNTVETETEVFRELIREYAIVIPVEEEEEEQAPVQSAGMEILTVDEYLARGDVDYRIDNVYAEAVGRVNSNINAHYRDNVLGKFYGNNLERIGAPVAWSRGYTGLGSKIAVFDTGIDVDHSEFDGRIIDTKCFTAMCEKGYETIDDGNRWSHGTHVAGIAAAAFDGEGTTGVAPDAELLIGKLAYNSGFFDFSVVDEAIQWAVDGGADVINMSASTRQTYTYTNTLEEIESGVYYSNNEAYAKYGYNNIFRPGESGADIIQAMKGHETVLVIAAGNDRAKTASPEAHIALDSEVGDRVLVVGMFDERKQDLSSWSNRAGTVCFDKAEDGTCATDARISDRYIIAPGSWIASSTDNNEYKTLSGTSMAAPHVAGAVAVVHQMWPHMTGANVSQLLLDTASTDGIKNYNPETHGQGMLDLAAATSPQGAVGIPTTGRVDGGKAVINGGTLAMSTGSISSLDEVMVIDDYDRDFYFNANDMMSVHDTRTASTIKAAQQGVHADNYIGYTGGQIVPLHNVALAINDDTGENTIAVAWEGFTLGMQNEKGSFLGNVADSELMRVNGAQTTYVGYQFDNGALFGNAQLGATSLDVDSSTLMKSADTLMSYSASLGVKETVGTSTWGATVSVPVTVATGKAHFNVASGVSSAGDLEYTNSSSSLATQRQEIDYGVFYNSAITETSSIETFAELRTNYAGTTDNTVEVGLSYKVRF